MFVESPKCEDIFVPIKNMAKGKFKYTTDNLIRVQMMLKFFFNH